MSEQPLGQARGGAVGGAADRVVSEAFGRPANASLVARRQRWNPSNWRLSTRLVVLSLLLLLVVQLFSLAAVRLSIERNARLQLAEQLEVGSRIWARLLEQRATKLGQGAALLAADFGFRSAVGSDDRETIASALENHGARIGAATVALLDTQYTLRAANPADTSVAAALAPLAPQLSQGGSRVAMVGNRPMQFVMVPLRSPLLVGWVVMGFDLDRSLVDDLNAVSGLHGSLLLVATGQAAKLLQTSLPEGSPARALAVSTPWADPSRPAPRGDSSNVAEPHLLESQGAQADATWVQRTVPVSTGAAGTVSLLLSAPLELALEPYEGLRLFLLVLTLAGLLLFALGNIGAARRVTQPLRSLAAASNRLGAGDYTGPVEHQQRGDEIGDLARAFEHMRVNIAANENEIRQLAYWDRLTGLPNRVQFRDAVSAGIQRARTDPGTPRTFAVVMLDLDRFKHVNDVLGYSSGDRLLKGVAERLQQVPRPSPQRDLIARLGGDEYALLLHDADAATAQQTAAQIAQAFEAPLALDDQAVDLSAAMGIAVWPEHGADVEPSLAADTLLSRAEVAMYAAKRRTTGAVLFDASLDSASAQTLSLLGELRRAVEGGELRLFLQPKVAIAERRLCGAEALLRWQHPQRGLVPPMQFIPFAEQTGFVRQLTLWIFSVAASHQVAARALGVQRVSVNLSTRDLMDQDLPEKLDELLTQHGAEASGFCLEITESAIMDDPARAEATINRLSAQGFKLSIDDFGTGYSSLAYLKRLPVNELKIDKSFVMGMTQAGGDEKIVRSTIDLAHNMGLSVVAEGVENADILARLAALGCDEAQGYHLGRPQPWDSFVAWAAQWAAQQVAQQVAKSSANPGS